MQRPSLRLAAAVIMYIIAVLLCTCIAYAQESSRSYRSPDSAQTVSDSLIVLLPDSVELEFVEVLNAVRTDPQSFLQAIDRYELYVRSFRNDKAALNKALKEIRARLKSEKPLSPLTLDRALQGAADDHVTNLSATGIMGHIGSDDSNPLTRVQRYGSFLTIGECITIGYLKTDMMVASMLVDEGTPDRGHRENLLSKKFTHVGVGVAEHPSLRVACVVVLGAN